MRSGRAHSLDEVGRRQCNRLQGGLVRVLELRENWERSFFAVRCIKTRLSMGGHPPDNSKRSQWIRRGIDCDLWRQTSAREARHVVKGLRTFACAHVAKDPQVRSDQECQPVKCRAISPVTGLSGRPHAILFSFSAGSITRLQLVTGNSRDGFLMKDS
jgi:hypothetical protein